MTNLIVVVLLALASIFAQNNVAAQAVPQPFPVSAENIGCPLNQDQLFLGVNGEVHRLCIQPYATESRTVVRLYIEPYGVQQIVPTRDELLVLTPSGRLTRYSQWGIQTTRIYGGGVIVGPGRYSNSYVVRYPYDGEEHEVHLSYSRTSFQEVRNVEMRDQNKLRCGKEVTLQPSKRSACLAYSSGELLVAGSDIAGPNYNNASYNFAGLGLTQIAAVGETIYGLIGTQYEYPEMPLPGPVSAPTKTTLGSLVAITVGFDGKVSLKTIREGLNVSQDPSQQILAVNEHGAYFVTVEYGKGSALYTLNHYNFRTGRLSALGRTNNFMSGLALGQSANALAQVVPQPRP